MNLKPHLREIVLGVILVAALFYLFLPVRSPGRRPFRGDDKGRPRQ